MLSALLARIFARRSPLQEIIIRNERSAVVMSMYLPSLMSTLLYRLYNLFYDLWKVRHLQLMFFLGDVIDSIIG